MHSSNHGWRGSNVGELEEIREESRRLRGGLELAVAVLELQAIAMAQRDEDNGAAATMEILKRIKPALDPAPKREGA